MIERTDAGIRVDVRGLLSASERRARRWRAAFQWSLVGGLLTLVLVGWWWGRGADLDNRRRVQVLTAELQFAQARGHCWRAIAMHAPGYGPTIPLAERDAAVKKCVDAEMVRSVAMKNGGKR